MLPFSLYPFSYLKPVWVVRKRAISDSDPSGASEWAVGVHQHPVGPAYLWREEIFPSAELLPKGVALSIKLFLPEPAALLLQVGSSCWCLHVACLDTRPNIHCKAGERYILMITVYNVFTIQSHDYLETIPDTALGRYQFVSLGMTQRPPDWFCAFCLFLSWFLFTSHGYPSLVGPTRSSALPREPIPGFYALERSQLHHHRHLYHSRDHG